MITHCLDAAAYLGLIGVFAAVAVVDVQSRRIPNRLLLIALVIKAVYFTTLLIMDFHYITVVLKTLLLSLSVTAICALAWKHIARSGIVIGGGDLKYLIVLSFCLDVDRLIVALLICIAILLLVWITALLRGRRDERIPGGLFLSAGAITVCICGCIETLIANNILFG